MPHPFLWICRFGYLEIWFFNPLRFARPPIFSLRSKQGDRIGLRLVWCVFFFFAGFLPSDSLPLLRQQIGGVPTPVGEGVFVSIKNLELKIRQHCWAHNS